MTLIAVPVVIAGVATTHVGLHQTAVVYSAALAVLAAAHDAEAPSPLH
jgi:hypothetical protein